MVGFKSQKENKCFCSCFASSSPFGSVPGKLLVEIQKNVTMCYLLNPASKDRKLEAVKILS